MLSVKYRSTQQNSKSDIKIVVFRLKYHPDQGSDRIDSFWFAKIWFTWAIILFLIFIHFDCLFKLILFIKPTNQNQIESKIKGRWILIHSFANHFLIRFRIKSESKWIANQVGPSPDPDFLKQTLLKFYRILTLLHFYH